MSMFSSSVLTCSQVVAACCAALASAGRTAASAGECHAASAAARAWPQAEPTAAWALGQLSPSLASMAWFSWAPFSCGAGRQQQKEQSRCGWSSRQGQQQT